MKIIEIADLVFGYEKNTPVLQGVSFGIEQGSITAILGKNGCGKSTLLDCIIGYTDYSHGEIFVDGENAKNLSAKKLAQKISYIPQNTISLMDYTVHEFILFGRNCQLSFGQTLSQHDYDLASMNAEKCGIGHLLQKDINKISGGERQLVFIARALTQGSPVIIMDEPTAALDFGNQARLLAIIKELQASDKTVIFTTHNPNHALRLNCQVIALHEGKVFAEGIASEIIDEALIRSLYGDDLTVTLKTTLTAE